MYCTWGFQKGDRKGRYCIYSAIMLGIAKYLEYRVIQKCSLSNYIHTLHTLHTSTRKGREGMGWDLLYILIMQLAARSIARSPM